MAWNTLSTWNSLDGAAIISAVVSDLGADTVESLGSFTITVNDSTGITVVTVGGIACTTVATPTGTTVTGTAPKAFGDNYGSLRDVVVNNGTDSAGYAVTVGIDENHTETDFTVAYAGLSVDSPLYGDATYQNLVIGDSCVFDTLTSPSSHTVSMSGDGEFTLVPVTVTVEQTFGFYIFDDSDNTAGTDGTITINPSGDVELSIPSATESDVAQAISYSVPESIIAATESNVAQSLSFIIYEPIIAATEGDTAQVVGFTQHIGVTAAYESDAAQTVSYTVAVDATLESLQDQITDLQAIVDELYIRMDMNTSVPNTYSDDGSVITNDEFTLTKIDNDDGTFTIART